jgi:molecular chaperone DnaK
MSIAVGIDLGTTNTVVAAVRDGRAVTLKDENSHRLLPSIVSFHPSGTVIVGDAAKERRIIDAKNTIFSVKRLIGRGWQSKEVQEAARRCPFTMKEGEKDTTVVVARGTEYTLPEISAFVLRRAKKIAETALGEPVDRAVITVPANFNDLQRASTKTAARLAGLDVLRILNEPTAAALAYGQSVQGSERMAVFDLGGGTFDITLLDLNEGVFEVLATSGDTALGGDDIDMFIADWVSAQILKAHRFDAHADPEVYARLRIIAEDVKIRLSTETEAAVDIDEIGYGAGGKPLAVRFKMTREAVERLAAPLIDRTIEVTRACFEKAGRTLASMDRVILVGGATRMPIVMRKVQEFFGRAAHVQINPDEVVALGAAMQAHVLSGRDKEHAPPPGAVAPPPQVAPQGPVAAPVDLASLPVVLGGLLGPAAAQSAPAEAAPRQPAPPEVAQHPVAKVNLVPRPAVPPVPPARPKLATLPFPMEPPPMEPEPAPAAPIVPGTESESPGGDAAGPALPDLVLAPRRGIPEEERIAAPPPSRDTDGVEMCERPHLLVDVTPFSLAVETAGGFCDILISANSPIPCDQSRVFTTAADGQVAVSVRVAQGEASRFAENTYLGAVELAGLPPKKRGELRIGVTFELDVNGMLRVSAKDTETGKKREIRLRLLGANTDAEDVEKMMQRGARHAVA